MHERRLKNQKQLTAGLFVVAWQQHVFQIGVQSLLVSEAKTITLATENSFGIATKNESATGLRKREIEMRCEAAIDRRQLLSHERRHIDLTLARSLVLAGRQL